MRKKCLPVLVLTMLLIATIGIGMCSASVASGSLTIQPKLTIDPDILKPIMNPPDKLTAAAAGSAISLTWQDNSNNEAGFEIERKVQTARLGGSFNILATVGAGVTSYTDTDVTAGTQYVYRVRAVSDTAVSAYSNEATITMATTSIINPNLQIKPKDPVFSLLPATPANLQAVPASTSEIKLNWVDQSSNENGFYLERKQGDQDFAQIAVISKDAIEHIDTGLQEGIDYTYRICSFNDYGSSAYSNESSSRTITTIYSQPAPTIIKYRIGQYSYSLNEVSYPMDAAPMILHSRTYLPIRYVAEPLGAAIEWDATLQKATVILNNIKVEMVLNSPVAWVDGVETPISNDPLVTPIVENGRILVPVAFVATSLGCQVDWTPAIQEITLTHPRP